jgi:2-haloacid dehalogenase
VLDVDPADAWMVAAHAWDLAGARGVGMRTAWLSRLESRFDENFGAPDVTGNNLRDAMEKVIAD